VATGFRWQTGHVWGGHTGGTDRCRPSRGVIGASVLVSSSRGQRAATLSGSQISTSVGVHSSTAQITSRSSSPMVVGLPIYRFDIFPALTSKPASAIRRRISVDFPIPASAAFIRRFQRIGSSFLSQSCRYPLVGYRPRVLDVVSVHMDLVGRGRKPFVAQNLLHGLEIHAPRIQRRRAVAAACAVGGAPPSLATIVWLPGQGHPAAPGHTPVCSARCPGRSARLAAAARPDPPSRHQNGAAHRSTTSPAVQRPKLIAGTSRVFGPSPLLPLP
jgi:hypothetical protein